MGEIHFWIKFVNIRILRIISIILDESSEKQLVFRSSKWSLETQKVLMGCKSFLKNQLLSTNSKNKKNTLDIHWFYPYRNMKSLQQSSWGKCVKQLTHRKMAAQNIQQFGSDLSIKWNNFQIFRFNICGGFLMPCLCLQDCNLCALGVVWETSWKTTPGM